MPTRRHSGKWDATLHEKNSRIYLGICDTWEEARLKEIRYRKESLDIEEQDLMWRLDQMRRTLAG